MLVIGSPKMKSGLKEVVRWFRSPWVATGILLQLSSFPLANRWIVSQRTAGDSPDNVLTALRCWFGSITLMLTAGFLCYLIALLRFRRNQTGPNSGGGDVMPPPHR
jgi:membrane-associated phospholipid phosphatase